MTDEERYSQLLELAEEMMRVHERCIAEARRFGPEDENWVALAMCAQAWLSAAEMVRDLIRPN